MSWTAGSQVTTTKEVKVSTLVKIKKDLDKCKLVRVAYDSLQIANADLIKYNLDYLQRLKSEEVKREKLQQQLDDSVKALRKKKKNWILPTSFGVFGGVILGVFISN